MASEPLVLYDNAFSPYAFKVRATLYEKGTPHRKHEMRVTGDREALLKVNPRGELSAISHGDTLVYDSSAICEYLESVFPEPPLFPSSPTEQARCRLLERMADGPIDGCVIGMAMVKFFAPQLEKSHPQCSRRRWSSSAGSTSTWRTSWRTRTSSAARSPGQTSPSSPMSAPPA